MDLTIDPAFLDAPTDDGAAPPADPVYTAFDTGPGGTDVATGPTLEDGTPVPGGAAVAGDDTTRAQMLREAQLQGQSIQNGSAFGGIGPPNTATFPGDPGTGQASGAPTSVPSGNGRALTPDEMAFNAANPNGGSFHLANPQGDVTLANASPITHAGLPGSSPATPAPAGTPSGYNMSLDQQIKANGGHGATGATGAGGGVHLPPGYENDPFAQAFVKEFGFFDPRYNSQQAMEQNLLRGDTAIRGAGVPGGVGRDQASYMAQFDPNLARELSAIGGTPNFYNSQNEADWAKAHNLEATGAANAFVQGGNQASARNVLDQRVQPPTHPIDNAHALLTDSMQKTLVDSLASLGATGFKQGIDPYGNMTLDYTSASGTPQSVKASFVDYANAMQELRNRVTQQQQAAAPAAAPTGGGYASHAAAAPRGALPPRGGGGGGYVAPAAAAAPPAASLPEVPGFTYGSVGGYPALAGGTPFNNHGQQQYPLISPTDTLGRNQPF